MASQISITDILSLKTWTTFGPQAAVNTYNFRCVNVTGGSVTDQDFVTAFAALMGTFYAAVCANGVTFNGCQCYFLRKSGSTFLPPPVKDTVGAGPCTGGADALPRNTALIMQYFSNVRRGPGGRGRVFIPFLATAVMDADGHPTTTVNTLVQGFFNSLFGPTIVGTTPNTATFDWVIIQRKPTLDFTLVSEGGPTKKFGQMHKRGDYGRANVSPI